MMLTLAKVYRHKKGGSYRILMEVESKIDGIEDSIIIYKSITHHQEYARTRKDFEESFTETNQPI